MCGNFLEKYQFTLHLVCVKFDFLVEELCAQVSHLALSTTKAEDMFNFSKFGCLYLFSFPLPLSSFSFFPPFPLTSFLFSKMKWLPCYSDLKLVISHQNSHIICTLVLVNSEFDPICKLLLSNQVFNLE